MYRKLESVEEKRTEKARGGEGNILTKSIFLQNDFGSSVTHFLFVTIPPGSSVGFHEHSGDEEVYFILEGHGKVRDDEKEYNVGVYDTILTNSGHCHGIENTGQRELKMLALIGKGVKG
jgi:mannose-6-phosphate isomerase-like protein (cupin superfamily)